MLFKLLISKNINDLIDFELGKLMYKVFNNTAPKSIIDIFYSGVTQHPYPTRHKDDPQYSETRNFSAVQDSFLCRGPSIWSQLNKTIKMCPTFKSFSNKLKKSFFM